MEIPDDEIYQERKDQIKTELDTKFDQINSIERISEPIVATDLFIEDQTSQIIGSMSTETNYYTITSKGEIYSKPKTDAAGTLTKITTIPPNSGEVVKTLNTDTQTIIYTNTGQFFIFSYATQEVSTPTIDGYTPNTNYIDLAVFSNNLYALSKIDQQLFRFTFQGQNSYLAPTGWFETPQTDLANSNSVSIDGEVYIGVSNNIKKYFQGINREFSLNYTEPALSNNLVIRTKEDIDQMFICDKNNKSINIFSKTTGEYVKQYKFDNLLDMLSCEIDYTNSKLYVSSGTKLYETDYQIGIE